RLNQKKLVTAKDAKKGAPRTQRKCEPATLDSLNGALTFEIRGRARAGRLISGASRRVGGTPTRQPAGRRRYQNPSIFGYLRNSHPGMSRDILLAPFPQGRPLASFHKDCL